MFDTLNGLTCGECYPSFLINEADITELGIGIMLLLDETRNPLEGIAEALDAFLQFVHRFIRDSLVLHL